MLKPVIAATALLTLAGGSHVHAQQSFSDFRFGDRQRAEFHHRPSAAVVSAFADARIAALEALVERRSRIGDLLQRRAPLRT